MDLKEIFGIERCLEASGYFDVSRIAREIYNFSLENNISIESILERISTQEPWEYIQGFVEFKNRKFVVTKNTLIPRVESEQMVDIAVDLIGRKEIEKVIDIGTGSGCIIISIAEESKEKDISFVGVDISEEALAIARMNSDGGILFKQRDLIKEKDLDSNTLVVANLPYIPTAMYEGLDRSVKDFEPRIALDGGKDGLLYYRKLFKIIKDSKKDIHLIIEIEPSTKDDIVKLLKDTPFQIFKDFREKERFLLLHFT